MRDQTTIVFVEVRYRSRSRFGSAVLTIDTRKQQRIRRAAGLWLERQRFNVLPACRFDVVALDDGVIQWIADAF